MISWQQSMRSAAVVFLTLSVSACHMGRPVDARQRDASSEIKAIRFLAREVPAWSRDNGCYSCHNNGDGARALYAAVRLGYPLPARALADTTAWVGHPDRWEHNRGDPGFSDQRLANIQFAASLLAASNAKQVGSNPLESAVNKLIADQAADGSWPVEPQNPIGSPTTYGTALATFMAWQSISTSQQPQAQRAAEAAEQYLRSVRPVTVPNAAVVLLAAERKQFLDETIRHDALAFLMSAASSEGGWGPYPDALPEVFDTALALLALASVPTTSEIERAMARGRAFLGAQQLADGSWPATTRPSGGQSYAQQLSTTGWATLALLRTGLAEQRKGGSHGLTGTASN